MQLNDALKVDGEGRPTDRHRVLDSRSWDEIRANTDQVYMPYRLRPRGRGNPRGSNYVAQVGSFTVSRFRYGAGVDLDRFEPGVGRGIVLTTLDGRVSHQDTIVTGAGEIFLVDASRSSYRLSADAMHDQLNMAFSHQVLADLHARWFGAPANSRMWAFSFQLGGLRVGSRWRTTSSAV